MTMEYRKITKTYQIIQRINYINLEQNIVLKQMMNLGEHIMMMIMKIMKIIIMIKFKTAMIKSNLCDCSDAYILVKGTITVPNMAAAAAAAVANNSNKKVISKKCGPFTTCITEIHKQVMMKILIQ